MSNIGISLIGTVTGNVKVLQKNRMITKKSKERGQMLLSSSILRQGCKVFFTSWMDKKPVNITSTFPTSADIISRNSKNKNTHKYELLQIQRPTVVGVYNTDMGGTDLQDQLISYYIITLRT